MTTIDTRFGTETARMSMVRMCEVTASLFRVCMCMCLRARERERRERSIACTAAAAVAAAVDVDMEVLPSGQELFLPGSHGHGCSLEARRRANTLAEKEQASTLLHSRTTGPPSSPFLLPPQPGKAQLELAVGPFSPKRALVVECRHVVRQDKKRLRMGLHWLINHVYKGDQEESLDRIDMMDVAAERDEPPQLVEQEDRRFLNMERSSSAIDLQQFPASTSAWSETDRSCCKEEHQHQLQQQQQLQLQLQRDAQMGLQSEVAEGVTASLAIAATGLDVSHSETLQNETSYKFGTISCNEEEEEEDFPGESGDICRCSSPLPNQTVDSVMVTSACTMMKQGCEVIDLPEDMEEEENGKPRVNNCKILKLGGDRVYCI